MDSQKFDSTTEILDAMKEMFLDVLQQVMESELDTELGYEKASARQKRLSKISGGIIATAFKKDGKNAIGSGRHLAGAGR